MISIVMPSYLGAYQSSARNREDKLPRAINSVLNQTYKDWELVIVADGCQRTMDIVQGMGLNGHNIKLMKIPKQQMWSGQVRNTGIEYATGSWICYLDNDDVLGKDHLALLAKAIDDEVDWLFFNDFTWNRKEEKFLERHCTLKAYKCGTSNIAHRRSMRARWDPKSRYGMDDWAFIKRLRTESSRFRNCAGEYVVCHIPVGKYDL